mmetsp:Transcript_18528/g.57471  ORF Transcript_18528/g.57471 Transcript_18528/m.57471 type:complete len:558 (-) Transcript_18528:840-2513(-)
MGACSSKTVRDIPCVAYAQTHSRSQVHEVAVLPLTKANFPSPSVPAFQRLHEIYDTCPRVRQHFAASEQALPLDAFYKQVVVEASNPTIPDGCVVPVLVVTRWRGDEGWDVAGYVGCRSYDADGRRTETSALQMFFKDGHKVPLTMPAIQLAARLFVETHALALQDDKATAGQIASATRAPWPRDCEWTIRRHNMEVRRVLEAVLVFWGLRPARTGTPDQPAPCATLFGPAGHHGYGAEPSYSSHQQRAHQAMQDTAPFLASFPLELRSATDELITVGCAQPEAISSLMADLAGWSSTTGTQWHADPAPLAMGSLLPSDFITRGGRMLVTGLSMNFRGTQQKTPAERRDVLGAAVADTLEMIQPAPRDPEEQAAIDRAHQSRREQRRAAKPSGVHGNVGNGGTYNPMNRPPPSYPGYAPVQQQAFGMQQQPMVILQQQPQHQPQQQLLQLPSAPPPPGFTYAFMQGADGALTPVLLPAPQQQPHPQPQQQVPMMLASQPLTQQQPPQQQQQQQEPPRPSVFGTSKLPQSSSASSAQPSWLNGGSQQQLQGVLLSTPF